MSSTMSYLWDNEFHILVLLNVTIYFRGLFIILRSEVGGEEKSEKIWMECCPLIHCLNYCCHWAQARSLKAIPVCHVEGGQGLGPLCATVQDALAGNRIRSTATRTWPVASIWDVDSVWHCSRRCQRSHSLARYAPAHSASVPPSQSWECDETWKGVKSATERQWRVLNAERMGCSEDGLYSGYPCGCMSLELHSSFPNGIWQRKWVLKDVLFPLLL